VEVERVSFKSEGVVVDLFLAAGGWDIVASCSKAGGVRS